MQKGRALKGAVFISIVLRKCLSDNYNHFIKKSIPIQKKMHAIAE